MAAQIPLVIGTTVPIQQLPAGDTLTAPLTVSAPNVLLSRLTTGAGGHEEIEPTDLTEDTALAGDDVVLGWNAAGELRKFKVGAFPSGGGGGSLGTGFTSGGGSGSIPNGTVAALEEEFAFETPDIATGYDGYKLGNKAIVAGWKNFFGFYDALENHYFGMGYDSEEDDRISMIGRFISTDDITSFQVKETRFNFTNSNTTGGGCQISGAAGVIGITHFDIGQIAIGGVSAKFVDYRLAPIGIEYDADYSATIAANDRSIPDVGTVKGLIAEQNFPAQLANAAAANGQFFYSTTDSKLSYKDPGGTVHNLY